LYPSQYAAYPVNFREHVLAVVDGGMELANGGLYVLRQQTDHQAMDILPCGRAAVGWRC